MKSSPTGVNSQPLTSTATWGLTLLSIFAISWVVNIWRELEKESLSAPPGRRPTHSSRENPSGLHIVYRPGSSTTSSNGSPAPCPSSKPKRESILSTIGEAAADLLLSHRG